MASKFHITESGDVRPCNARKRACRYGETEHYENKKEALQSVERAFEKEFSPIKTHSVNKNHEKLLKEIDMILKNDAMSPDSLQKVGEIFEKEILNRLDFNPFSRELTQEEILVIENENKKLFSELIDTTGNITSPVEGPLAEQLNEAVNIIPSSVKSRLGPHPFFTKNIKTRSKSGHHKFGNIERTVLASSDTEVPDTVPDNVAVLEDHNKYYLFKNEILDPDQSFSVSVKVPNKEKPEKRWVGNHPISNRGRKVSNTTEMFVNGEIITLDKPSYLMKTKEFTVASEIAARKNLPHKELSSVLLHEYCHAVQDRYSEYNIHKAEKEMYHSIALENKYSKEYDIHTRNGFPDDYMGATTGKELFPTATEAIFSPSTYEKNYLYGINRHENADKVRKWIFGVWINLGRKELKTN